MDMARQDRQACIGVANAQGENDAQDWLSETPSDQWAAAVAPSALGADEALINAIGAKAVAAMFGLAEDSDDFGAACSCYSSAWRDAVVAAIREQETRA
jgi:hypothetical protein